MSYERLIVVSVVVGRFCMLIFVAQSPKLREHGFETCDISLRIYFLAPNKLGTQKDEVAFFRPLTHDTRKSYVINCLFDLEYILVNLD
jgi:hypothetical protein